MLGHTVNWVKALREEVNGRGKTFSPRVSCQSQRPIRSMRSRCVGRLTERGEGGLLKINTGKQRWSQKDTPNSSQQGTIALAKPCTELFLSGQLKYGTLAWNRPVKNWSDEGTQGQGTAFDLHSPQTQKQTGRWASPRNTLTISAAIKDTEANWANDIGLIRQGTEEKAFLSCSVTAGKDGSAADRMAPCHSNLVLAPSGIVKGK